MADIQINVVGNAQVTLRDLAEGAKKADADTKELKESVTALGSAMQQMKTRAVDGLIDSLKEFALTIPQGTANAARHEQALRALGPAYALVQNQTRGAVSAEQAWQVQQRLTQSGLRVSAQELANITMRAREYARATGTETTQALEQLTDALRQGGGEEIRKFGITVQAGITRTEGFQQALRQLDTQARTTAPSMLSATESQDRFNRSVETAKNNLQAFIAQKGGLQDFFEQTSSWLEEATKDADSFTTAIGRALRGIVSETTSGSGVERGALDIAVGGPLAGMIRSLGGRQGAENRADRAGRGVANSLLGGAPGALFDALESMGVVQGATQGATRDPIRRTSSVGQNARQVAGQAVQGATQAAAQARQQAADVEARALEAERRRQAELERRAQLAPVDPNQLRAARLALRQAQLDAQAGGAGDDLGITRNAATPTDQRAARLSTLRSAATAMSAQRGENEVARLNRIAAATREYTQTLARYREEDERVATQLQASAEAESARRRELNESNRLLADTMRQERAERLVMRDEELQIRRQTDAAADPSGRGDRRRQQERARDLVTLRDTYGELLAQTDQRLAAARVEGRDLSEINGLMQERLGLLRAQSAATQELTAIQREQSAATREFKTEMVSALGGVAQGFADSAVAALDGKDDFAHAIGDMLREQAKALAKMSIFKVLENTALGLAAAAGFMPGSAANYFAAAGMWAALGALSGAAVYATRPPDRSNEKSGGASSRAGSSGGSAARADTGGGGGPLVLNINVSGALFNDGVTESVAREVRRAQAQNLLPMSGRV